VAAAERKSRDAGRAGNPSRRGQAEGLGLVVEVPPCGPALGAGRAVHRVHAYTLHARQVDHQAAVADRKTRHAMAAAADRYDQVVISSERHRRHHVSDPGAADDQRGAPVDHPIMNFAGALIVLMAGTEQFTA